MGSWVGGHGFGVAGLGLWVWGHSLGSRFGVSGSQLWGLSFGVAVWGPSLGGTFSPGVTEMRQTQCAWAGYPLGNCGDEKLPWLSCRVSPHAAVGPSESRAAPQEPRAAPQPRHSAPQLGGQGGFAPRGPQTKPCCRRGGDAAVSAALRDAMRPMDAPHRCAP